MLVFGHRGAAWDAPENTLAAVKEGLRQGADGVEVDVRLSLDGRVTVIHDDTFERTAFFKGRVSETSSYFIKKLDAGKFKSPVFAGEKVPFLPEILDTVPAGKLLQIEIKSGADIVPRLSADIRSSVKARSEIMAIGFDWKVLKIFKEMEPDIAVVWINGRRTFFKRRMPPSEEMVHFCRLQRFNGVDFDCRFPMDARYVRVLKSAGLSVYSWTVDMPEKALYLKEIGVDGVASNRPGFIMGELGRF